MSTGVGTLRKSSRRSLWPAAVVLSFVMLTVAVVVFSIDRGSTTQAPSKPAAIEAPAASVASGTQANTPSELRAATAAAERSGVRGHAGPARGANAGTQMGTNTPSEITGGLQMPTPQEIRARELRRP